jgi:hypothetical protein
MNARLENRITAYLDRLSPAISGSGGHNQTFKVARILLFGFGLPIPDAWPLMKLYNLKCEPPWSDKELKHKLASAKALGPGKQKSLL